MVWDVRGMGLDHEQVIRVCFTKAASKAGGDNHCHVVLVGGNPHPSLPPLPLCLHQNQPFLSVEDQPSLRLGDLRTSAQSHLVRVKPNKFGGSKLPFKCFDLLHHTKLWVPPRSHKALAIRSVPVSRR